MKSIHAIALNTSVDIRMAVSKFSMGEVLRSKSYSEYPSGKAVNCAKTISMLGAHVNLYCLCGHNDISLFQSLSPNITSNVTGVEGLTRKNLTLVQSDGELICHIQNNGYSVSDEILNRFEGLIHSNIKDGDIVVVSGSVPVGAGPRYLSGLVERVLKKKVSLILDSDPAFLDGMDYADIKLVKPNLGELCRLSGKRLETVAEIAVTAYELIDSELVVVSLGHDGAVWIDRNSKRYVHAKTCLRATGSTDSIGCGDAMVAAFALGIARNSDSLDILKSGISAGYAHMFSEGPGAVDLDRYAAALSCVDLTEFTL